MYQCEIWWTTGFLFIRVPKRNMSEELQGAWLTLDQLHHRNPTPRGEWISRPCTPGALWSFLNSSLVSTSPSAVSINSCFLLHVILIAALKHPPRFYSLCLIFWLPPRLLCCPFLSSQCSNLRVGVRMGMLQFLWIWSTINAQTKRKKGSRHWR